MQKAELAGELIPEAGLARAGDACDEKEVWFGVGHRVNTAAILMPPVNGVIACAVCSPERWGVEYNLDVIAPLPKDGQ